MASSEVGTSARTRQQNTNVVATAIMTSQDAFTDRVDLMIREARLLRDGLGSGTFTNRRLGE
jgi:hypothetical protein